MFKDLLLAITGTAGDANALAAATALVKELEARLCALVPVNLPVPMPGSWGMVPDTAMSPVYDDLRAKARGHAERITQQLAAAGISFEVRIAESLFSEPPHTAAVHARYADMTVMTLAGDEDDGSIETIGRYFSSLLMETGRPLLTVPVQGTSLAPIRHAVVAWRPSHEASRALHDAIPLLGRAETVDVVEVTHGAGDKGDGDLPGADIAAHLARHGLKVRVVVHPQRGESVAAALLRHADQSGAQLLVAGGYGHSRLREWALGGVTRELLRSARLPVLFSH